MRIEYKSLALRDIRKKSDYIANVLKNKSAALKLRTSILRAVSLLKDNPRMGTMLSSKYEGIETDLRYIIVSKQLIFYRITNEDLISIIRVLDGRRDYMSILFP